MRESSFVLDFSQIRAADITLAGGKGANLGEMAGAGFPVPPGFCLTTQAFRRFMAAVPDLDAFYAELEALSADDLDAVRRAGERIRRHLLALPIPPDVAAATLDAWRQSGVDAAYAVRSSATAEDLPGASFAGQQDTYLNVIGETALLDAVRRCWVSLFNDRAILYRLRNGFSQREAALAVVVQEMILAEKSGILFTADPMSGHRRRALINAGFGLGEALVSGLVTPDAWLVDKRALHILSRQISDKKMAIYPLPQGGTQRVDLPPEQRKQPVLNDEQILALAEMGIRAEAHYGQPQDIEWALDGEKLYLLQSRPITSLYPIDGLAVSDDALHVFFSLGHQQNMTRAMPPLSLHAFHRFMPTAAMRSYFRFSGGRIFIDLTRMLHTPLLRRIVPALLSQFNARIPAALAQITARPEFQRPADGNRSLLKAQPRSVWAFLKGLASIMRRMLAALWWRDHADFLARTNAFMDARIDEIRRRLQAAPAGREEIAAILDEMPQLWSIFMTWVPEALAGVIATRLLERLARPWLSAADLEALTLAIPGNVVNEMNLALGDLSRLAAECPALRTAFQDVGEDAAAWLEKIADMACAAPFLQAWERFLARYGARCSSEIDIASPRWHEDPLPLLRVIAVHIQRGEDGRARFEQMAQAREAAFLSLMDASGRGPLGWLRRRIFSRLYRVMLSIGGMREHHKFFLVRFVWEVKKVVRVLADDLTAAGKLSAPDDIWFLTWDELLEIWDSEQDWMARSAPRRADLARYQKLTPPVVITSEGEIPQVSLHVQDAPPGALPGDAVSAGVVEGVAHVIRDPLHETLAPGEILVAEFTDPGWTPLFINAAGLVMEIGGALAHGSVVAREYGIPAVVGVEGATRRICSGQRLRVDGDRGFVEILS